MSDDMPRSIEFRVTHHKPVPEGSMRVRFERGKAGLCWANAAALIPFRRAIACAWQKAIGRMEWDLEEAFVLEEEFYFARPRDQYKKDGALKEDAPRYPIKTSVGDVDKLARAVSDSLTGYAYHDDSQVVRVTASKHYSEKGVDGVRVVVTKL